jgi:hypothetical protein
LLLVIVALVVLAGTLFPRFNPPGRRTPIMACMNNLRQIAFASVIYGTDHGDRFPWTAEPSATNSSAGTAADCYRLITASGGFNARILVFPTDSKRFPTTNFLHSANLSYFVNLSSRMNETNRAVFGDRHLATNSVPVGPGRIILSPGYHVDWTLELHRVKSSQGKGVVVFTDGHCETSMGSPRGWEEIGAAVHRAQTLLIP